MIIDLPIGTPTGILYEVADELGISLVDTAPRGRVVNSRDAGQVVRVESVRLALGADRDRYRAYRHGRRVNAVSWEGHRDWMRRVFQIAPTTVIRTALDTWRGSEDFEARHEASRPRDFGTPMSPSGAFPGVW